MPTLMNRNWLADMKRHLLVHADAGSDAALFLYCYFDDSKKVKGTSVEQLLVRGKSPTEGDEREFEKLLKFELRYLKRLGFCTIKNRKRDEPRSRAKVFFHEPKFTSAELDAIRGQPD